MRRRKVRTLIDGYEHARSLCSAELDVISRKCHANILKSRLLFEEIHRDGMAAMNGFMEHIDRVVARLLETIQESLDDAIRTEEAHERSKRSKAPSKRPRQSKRRRK